MKARMVIFGIVLASVVQAAGQHVIGLDKEEVKTLVKKQYRDFSHDHTIVKQQFNYLKYVNSSGTKTFLIYFDENDIARSAKMVCDYAEYDFIRDDLDEQFGKSGKNQWTYSVGDQDYLVSLTEQDWYFTIKYQRSE